MCTDFRKPLRRVAIKFGDLFYGMAYGKKGNMVARQGTKLRRRGSLAPDRLVLFEPHNVPLTEMASRFLESLEAGETSISPVGAPVGTILNQLAGLRSLLLTALPLP